MIRKSERIAKAKESLAQLRAASKVNWSESSELAWLDWKRRVLGERKRIHKAWAANHLYMGASS